MAFERLEIERKQKAKTDGPIDWSGGMDMDLDIRACRSLYVLHMPNDALKKVHKYELAIADRMSDKKNNMPNFDVPRRFMLLMEMRNLTGHASNFKFNKDDLSLLCKWVLQAKPRLEDFPEWHGLQWHHAWDWNTKQLDLPVLSRAKGLKDELREF